MGLFVFKLNVQEPPRTDAIHSLHVHEEMMLHLVRAPHGQSRRALWNYPFWGRSLCPRGLGAMTVVS